MEQVDSQTAKITWVGVLQKMLKVIHESKDFQQGKEESVMEVAALEGAILRLSQFDNLCKCKQLVEEMLFAEKQYKEEDFDVEKFGKEWSIRAREVLGMLNLGSN